MKNRLILMLLSALGFACCTKPAEPEIVEPGICEYGCPFACYSVKGSVRDSDGNPIPNIAVGLNDRPTGVYLSQFTDGNGEFVFDREDSWPQDTQWLVFYDHDGEANGGTFETAEMEVAFTKVGEGDGKWFHGEYEAPDVTVTLVRGLAPLPSDGNIGTMQR